LDRRAAAAFRGQTIGFPFQEFNLMPVLTAYENVEYPLLLVQRVPAPERRQRVLALLDAVGVADQRGKYPDQLSGGQSKPRPDSSPSREIAMAFRQGDFQKPFTTHSEVPPGVPSMQRLNGEIAYTFEETAQRHRSATYKTQIGADAYVSLASGVEWCASQ
jgi:hypothetical protein